MKRTNLIVFLLALAGVLASSACLADEPPGGAPSPQAGSNPEETVPHGWLLDPSRFLLRASIVGFLPTTERSGLRVSLANDQGFAVDGTYFLHPNFGLNLFVSFLTSDISSTRARAPTSTSSLGSQHLLPIIATAQYHFCPDCRVRPYAGAGIGGPIPLSESGNLKLVQPRIGKVIGVAGEAGLDYMINQHFSLNLDCRFVRVDTHAKTTGIVTTQGGLRVDNVFLGGGFGYRF